MIFKLILLIFAILIFLLVAFGVLDSDIVKWEAGAFAAFAAAFLPWPDR